jgi:hypothetical protein
MLKLQFEDPGRRVGKYKCPIRACPEIIRGN